MTQPATGFIPTPHEPRSSPDSVWSTSTGADPAHSIPGELDALGRHVGQSSRGRWFALGVLADSVRSFVAPRLVTVLVAAALLAIAVSLAV